jgi:hypothetical protein
MRKGFSTKQIIKIVRKAESQCLPVKSATNMPSPSRQNKLRVATPRALLNKSNLNRLLLHPYDVTDKSALPPPMSWNILTILYPQSFKLHQGGKGITNSSGTNLNSLRLASVRGRDGPNNERSQRRGGLQARLRRI